MWLDKIIPVVTSIFLITSANSAISAEKLDANTAQEIVDSLNDAISINIARPLDPKSPPEFFSVKGWSVLLESMENQRYISKKILGNDGMFCPNDGPGASAAFDATTPPDAPFYYCHIKGLSMTVKRTGEISEPVLKEDLYHVKYPVLFTREDGSKKIPINFLLQIGQFPQGGWEIRRLFMKQ